MCVCNDGGVGIELVVWLVFGRLFGCSGGLVGLIVICEGFLKNYKVGEWFWGECIKGFIV